MAGGVPLARETDSSRSSGVMTQPWTLGSPHQGELSMPSGSPHENGTKNGSRGSSSSSRTAAANRGIAALDFVGLGTSLRSWIVPAQRGSPGPSEPVRPSQPSSPEAGMRRLLRVRPKASCCWGASTSAGCAIGSPFPFVGIKPSFARMAASLSNLSAVRAASSTWRFSRRGRPRRRRRDDRNLPA